MLALTNLKDLGIVKVEIEFSGSGDSGDIDEVNYYIKSKDWDTHYSETLPSKYDDLFKDLGWDILTKTVDTVGDWVNNEGGYGNISINVEDKTYDVDYHQRTTDDYDWSDEMLFI